MKIINESIIYEDNVYVIELSDEGEDFAIQYNGILCHQYNNRGICRYKFKSESKFVNFLWWYKLFYLPHNTVRDEEGIVYNEKEILTEILKVVNEHTKLNITLDEVTFFDEALIKFSRGKEYIITWENCD